jgi:hypothetical protein
MALVLSVVGLIGLIIFVVFGLLWILAAPARRPNNGTIALVGLIIWAIATIIVTLIALF